MTWWKEAVVYQIYPRSFNDSNGDGIGDLPGIIEKLPYLKDLGVSVIWLCPVYESPNDDNGYDISDYYSIHSDYGTMSDMEDLIQLADQYGIKIVMDLVVNHTSDEHSWFRESKKSTDNPYRDYYIWRDPVNGGPPNDMQSTFGGSAWQFDPETNQYYLHLFSKKQPDLNWKNPVVRQEIYKMMNFWLQKGIGGFRLDVIENIGKEVNQKIVTNGPKLHDYIQEMNRETFGRYDVMTVGETWAAGINEAKLYSHPDREEFSMVFQFEHITLDQEKEKWDLKKLDVRKLKRVLSKWQTELDGEGWNSLFWNNHDTPRIISRWGNDQAFRIQSAQLFATLLHLMKGTPYIYQGEEIGMTNLTISDIAEVDDIEAINMYHDRLSQGYPKRDIIASINAKGRDNARTPMQWDDTANAGFTSGEPWLKVNPNYIKINVDADRKAPNSIFSWYKKMVDLRKANPLITYGSYHLLIPDHPSIFAYERTYNKEKWIVIANIGVEKTFTDQVEINREDIFINNYNSVNLDNNQLSLEPYQVLVAKKVLSNSM